MAGGWASEDDTQKQIDDTISDIIAIARRALPTGISNILCDECENEIPEARRIALKGVKYCVKCQHEIDVNTKLSLFNRRGSKDIQLR